MSQRDFAAERISFTLRFIDTVWRIEYLVIPIVTVKRVVAGNVTNYLYTLSVEHYCTAVEHCTAIEHCTAVILCHGTGEEAISKVRLVLQWTLSKVPTKERYGGWRAVI